MAESGQPVGATVLIQLAVAETKMLVVKKGREIF